MQTGNKDLSGGNRFKKGVSGNPQGTGSPVRKKKGGRLDQR